jgi:hypothetical protein
MGTTCDTRPRRSREVVMKTNLCQLLGIEYPIMAAPMGPDLTGTKMPRFILSNKQQSTAPTPCYPPLPVAGTRRVPSASPNHQVPSDPIRHARPFRHCSKAISPWLGPARANPPATLGPLDRNSNIRVCKIERPTWAPYRNAADTIHRSDEMRAWMFARRFLAFIRLLGIFHRVSPILSVCSTPPPGRVFDRFRRVAGQRGFRKSCCRKSLSFVGARTMPSGVMAVCLL